METIRFSQLGKEDLKIGRGPLSTFEVTLADGRVVNLNEIDLWHGGYNLDDYTSLLSAVNAIGPRSTTLIVSSKRTVETVTIPATLALIFLGSGEFDIPSGSTVTINGPMIAPLKQIFSGAGSITIGSGYIERIYPQWWGAKGDDATDNSTAFNNAITALPTNGGEIYLGEGQWRINTATINPGSKNVKIRGIGWKTLVATSFGDAQWTASNAVKGSVIKVTGTTNGITLNDATYRKLILEDVAILGPGTGTSIGVDAGSGAQNNQLVFRNVFIGNFATGLRLRNALDGQFHELYISGNTTGINFTVSTTNHKFYGLTLQNNTTGMSVGATSLIKIYGGLIQSNTTGINLAPEVSGNIAGFHIDGVWFEGNTSSWKFDSTNGAITDISFRNCRESTNFTMTPVVVNTIARISIEDCQVSGWTLDFTNASITQINLKNLTIAAVNLVTGNSQQRVTRININGINTFSDLGKVITFAATVTPDFADGEVQQITLTGNITINVPANAPYASKITYIIRQDGTGGRTVTWGAGYHTGWVDTGNTANKYSTLTFYNVSGQWIQLGDQAPYFN